MKNMMIVNLILLILSQRKRSPHHSGIRVYTSNQISAMKKRYPMSEEDAADCADLLLRLSFQLNTRTLHTHVIAERSTLCDAGEDAGNKGT